MTFEWFTYSTPFYVFSRNGGSRLECSRGIGGVPPLLSSGSDCRDILVYDGCKWKFSIVVFLVFIFTQFTFKNRSKHVMCVWMLDIRMYLYVCTKGIVAAYMMNGCVLFLVWCAQDCYVVAKLNAPLVALSGRVYMTVSLGKPSPSRPLLTTALK